MKSVYEASTALDAHMILNLLEQEGIAGRVDGEYLPGGVGELQAINLVRVMVEEADVERARRIIRDWEAIQVAEETQTAQRRSGGGFTGFVLGCLAGGGLVFWWCHSTVTGDGIDLNGDGRPDEARTYRDGRISRTERDRNFDGRADLVTRYDRRGLVTASESDDDFDGVFETVSAYVDGQIATRASDLNQDGTIDLRASFRSGILDELLILGDDGDRRSKRQVFHMGKRVTADYDSDGDGSFDVHHDYDHFEEIR
jgi:hypothetical protein